MKHLAKFGKFLTPEMIEEIGLPLCRKSLPSPDSKLTTEQMDEHLVLSALMLDHAYASPRRDLFIDLSNAIQQATTEVSNLGGLNDDNSFVVCRGAHMTREWVGLAKRVSELFIDRLYDRNHWTTNYLNAYVLEQYHPFIQFLYLTEAHNAAIEKMLSNIEPIPAAEIDTPAE